MVFGSMGAAGLVALAALADIFMKVPFRGRVVMDIMFLLGAGLVIFMGWDAYKESK
jgi:hypothetical protein